MNKLRSVIFVPLRGYRPRRKPQKYSGAKKSGTPEDVVANMSQEELYFDADGNDFDPENFDDMEKHESDFSEAGTTHKQHIRDMFLEKEKLKTRIIARKYFKSEDPNFLTWTEKEEIKSLHKKDSVEWSPERLSEAFPALPETIKKVLRAEWQPLSAKTIRKYDEKVIENWKLFRAKKIPLSPKLEAHLEKFKGRKVVAADMKQIAEKFVKIRPVLPDPQATLFTDLVRGYVESKETPKNVPKITDGREKKELSFEKPKNFSGKKIDFDTFMKETVEGIGDEKDLSPEMGLLVDEYKKKKQEKAIEDLRTLKLQTEVKTGKNHDLSIIVEENELVEEVSEDKKEAKSIPVVRITAERQEMVVKRREEFKLQKASENSKNLGQVKEKGVKVTVIDVPKLNIEENSPLTGIIEWKKIEAFGTEDYPQFIKIPRDKASKNITFKVEDRYYDCDGEFLYRVPGFKS